MCSVGQFARIFALVEELFVPIGFVADVNEVSLGERDQRAAYCRGSTLIGVGRIGTGEFGDRGVWGGCPRRRSGGIAPQCRERSSWERFISAEPAQVDDGGRKVAQAGDLLHYRRDFGRGGGDDQKRDCNLRAVETLSMVEQLVLAQPFAMIGGDDEERSLEQTAALQ